MQLTDRHEQYWKKNLRMTTALLVVWFVITFVISFLAREEFLRFNFFGWPFSFWMGAQGALLLYVLLVWIYTRVMRRLDDDYDVGEGEEP